MRLFDSHCHFDVDAFSADRNEVLQRSRHAGVTDLLVPAIDFASWSVIRDLCHAQAGLHPAFGLHPMFIARHLPAHLDAMSDWLQRERPCAVGECGLDFFVDGLDPQAQRVCFQRQIELAHEFDLPLVIHARRALDEVIQRLRRVGGVRGVVHSFSGSKEQAAQLWKLGFSVGVGGPLTYPRAQRLRRLVASMPIEFLLLETDAPDQPDAAWRGRRNEPARLLEVARCAATLRGETLEAVAAATFANAQRLFGLDGPAG